MSTSLSDAGLPFANGDTQAYAPVPVRQTVLSGGVDSNGFASFGGSTGAATVTASTTLIATAANGASNRTGSIVNPSWTGLSTNGTMYLGLTVNADGTCTPFSTTLAPNYQWGGTFSTTANQRTFNIQQMQMQVGNGSTAAQSYDVFVGEVTVASGVVSAIVWYALMGRYVSSFTATLPAIATAVSFNHNIGTNELRSGRFIIECTTADAGFAVGDRLDCVNGGGGANLIVNIAANWTSKVVAFCSGGLASNVFAVLNKTTGAYVALTAASWKYRAAIARDF